MRPIRKSLCLLIGLSLLCGPMLRAATFTWTGSVSSDWFNPTNWSPGGVPAPSDTVNFSSGTINLTNSISISGQFNWSGGTLAGDGVTVAVGGVMNISGTSYVYLENPLTNSGTVNWSGTVGIQIYNNSGSIQGMVQNLPGGMWNIQCDQSMIVYSGTPFFNNAGSVVKNGTSGTTTISVPFLNSGSVTNLSGTINFTDGGPLEGIYTAGVSRLIEFSGGSFTNAGVVVNGPGTVAFNGGNLTLPTNVIPNLVMSGGNIILGPAFQGGTITNLALPGSILTGTNIVTGTLICDAGFTGPMQVESGATLTLTNGTVTGSLTVALGAVLNITGNSWLYLFNALTNFGTVNWTENEGIQVYNNGSSDPGMIQNEPGGVWNILCDQQLVIYSGSPFFNNAGSVVKSGTTGTTTISIPFYNTGTVTNLGGTLNFTGGGPIEGAFTAASAASVINFNGNFTNANPVLTGPGLLEFSGGNLTLPFNTIPNLVMNGGNVILGPGFQGGTVTNLVLLGSTLTGTNVVTGSLICDAGFSGAMQVASGGTLTLTNGTVTGPLTVASGAVLNITGTSWLYLFNALTNFGTVNWTETAGIQVYNNGSSDPGMIQNEPGGIWNILCDQPMYVYSGNPFFNNAGTIVKSVTTGTTMIDVPFYNSGTVTNLSGTINFADGGTIGGVFTAAAGKVIEFSGGNFTDGNPVLSGPGIVEFNGGTLTLNTDIIPNLLLAGGNLVLGPSFQGGTITNLVLSGTILTSTNTVTGTLTVTNGTMNAPLTVASGGVLNITGNSWFYINNPLTNAGTVNWTGTVGIYIYNSGNQLGMVQNLPGALWNMECDESMNVNTGNPFFNNLGDVVKSVTTGTTTINVPFYNSGVVTNLSGTINFGDGGSIGGVYTAATGAAINFTGGSFNVGNPIINGPGAVSQTGGTLTFLSSLIPNLNLTGGTVILGPGFEGGSITNLTLAGGILSGTNTVTGTLNWTAGTLSGPLTVAVGGVLNISGSSAKYIQAQLVNLGSVDWTGAGALYIYNNNSSYSGSIWNMPGAVFNIATDESINCACYGDEYIVNQGTLEKTAGTGQTYIYVAVTNTGAINGLEGNLNFSGGGYIAGSYTASSGASVNFTGGNFTSALPTVGGSGLVAETGGAITYYTNMPASLALNGGTVVLDASFQSGSITNLTLSGATLIGTNTVTGTFSWTAGTLNGPLTIAADGVLNISGSSAKFVESGLTNLGSVDWIGTGALYIYNNNSSLSGSIWNMPGGVFNIATDENINCACYGYEYIVNEGTFEKTAATGNTYINVVVTNSGTIEGLSGTLSLNDGGSIGGSFTASSGAAVYLSGGNFTVGNPAISGAGTVAFNGGTMTLLSSQVANLSLVGGTLLLGPAFDGGSITNLTLAGSSLAGTNTVTGTITWTAGALSGPLTIASNGLLLLSGSANKFLEGLLTNYGTLTWTGTGNFYIYNNNSTYLGAIYNQPGGLFEMENDQIIYCACYGYESINNLGTVEKLIATNTTTIYVPFTNNGTLNLQSGLVNFNAGNAYVQAGETLDFGISGTNNNNGQFTMPGNINFDGTLGVNLLNGFTPSTNETFTLINYGSHGGAFSSLNLPALPAGMTWEVDYVSSGLMLRVLPPAPTDTLQIGGAVTDTNGNPIAGATVYAFIVTNTYTNAIINGSFEQPPNNGTNYIIYNPGSTSIPGWTVTSLGLIDIADGFLGAAEDGNQYFDPTGNLSGMGGGIAQTFPTIAGVTYKLAFFMGYRANPGIPSLGVTVGSISNSFIAGGGSGGLNWTPQTIYFIATSNQTTVTFQTVTSFNSDDSFVDNVQVTPPDAGRVLQAVTDSSGHYQIAVANGSFQVGVSGLPALGYNNVAQQTAIVATANQTVNFTASALTSGQLFTINTSVNPPGSGTASGGGTFGSGAIATVTALPITSVLPYYFANWTENGVFQSATNVYSFAVIRSRNLVANFTLPLYTIIASNNPANGGVISGAGSYFYGATNILIATPNFGFNFTNWTEGANIVGTTPALTNVIYTNHVYVANYVAANLVHLVSTVTLPPSLATVAGAGSYTNGQTAIFSAPMFVTNSPYFYIFQQFTLSNTVVSTSNTFNKTFSTLDATNLTYVAVYKTMTILPQVTNVTVNYVNPVPATTNFLLTMQFDRSMHTNISPLVVLSNSAAIVQPVVMTNGYWTMTASSNDTYHVPPVTFSAGMDGTMQLYVSGAQDLNGDTMNPTNPASYTVESTPPPAPVITLVSSNSSSATVSWTGYSAPPTLAGFRIYLATTNYTSLSSLPAYTSLGSTARSYTYYGLLLNTNYYLAVQAVDNAGNALTAVTPLSVYLPSTIPPPVPIQVTASGGTSATISWSGYSTASLLGFSGYQIYYQQSNFSTVAGLTPQTTVGPGQTSFQVNGLDRTKTTYFAVVGYNNTNGFNPSVTTASWSDPYAGNIGVNTTIGGPGQNVVNIYHSILVVSNATLTIQPGTTLLFAPGTSLTVQQGALAANGTALAPIIFDSANDVPGLTAAPGDWGGITLQSGAGASSLQFVEILFGGGLTISGCSPNVQAFTANNNINWGLGLNNGASLNTSAALLTGNGIGAEQSDTSTLAVENSVLLNNNTNAWAAGTQGMTAISNWWGSATQTNISASLAGNVNYTPFLTYEPLLTPAIGTSNGVTQVGGGVAILALACRTAVSMRLSEDFTFTGVFFSPFTNYDVFSLSAGGGLKHIFAQFRSTTGATNSPIELDVNYVTAGPVIQSFSLTDGETLNRPLMVAGSATATLGMRDIEFYLDGVGLATNLGGSFSYYFDVRNFSDAVHEAELLARDNSGNVATLEEGIVINVTPPPAPVIISPPSDYITNNGAINVIGTAEPRISVQVTDNGSVLGTTTADTNGNFSVTNVTLVEGVNTIVASASDSTGITPSAGRHITVETIPPAAVLMNPLVYTPGAGLSVTWYYATTGKQATSFELFWSTTTFTNASQAPFHSIMLNLMNDTLQGLADGTYYFGVVGYDAAGNPSPLSSLVSAVYHATPPALNIAYGASSPVGPGPLSITLSSSESLASTPTLTVQPAGSAPVLLSLTNAALNIWQTVFSVTPGTPSGAAAVQSAAQDPYGNVFNGAPSGPALSIDTTPPAGTIVTVPSTPVQTLNTTNVAVQLTLSKLEQAGLTPTLNFQSPLGNHLTVPLSGAGSNWNGTLTLSNSYGTGFGHFSLSAEDSVGNIGTNIISGTYLELYNTALPPPPAAPTGLSAVSLPGGSIRLSWNSVSNAQIYRLYREPGTNFTMPASLDIDNITNVFVTDLPTNDGLYAYAVSASRLGSESGFASALIAISDSLPPPAPTNVVVVLAASGVAVSWQQPPGEVPNHYNVYRNGVLINTTTGTGPIVDYPPRGTNTYVVDSSDAIGNLNPSLPVSITLLVSPVSSLTVVVIQNQAVTLSWVSTDATATGFNVYRNSVLQNANPLTGTNYTDNLPLSDAVTYAVTAVNALAQESPPRLVTVCPLALGLQINPPNQHILVNYFDQYQIGITNESLLASLPVAQLVLNRSVSGASSLIVTQAYLSSISAGGNVQPTVIVPEAPLAASQTVQLAVFQQTDSQGSMVAYQNSFTFTNTGLPGVEIALSANQQPLAGGLGTFQAQINNPGTVPIEVVTAHGNGSKPGDLYISVENSFGQIVSSTLYQGTPPGTTFLPDGRAYVQIAPGASLSITVSNVLVPAALTGTTNVTFTAGITNIYSLIGTPLEVSSGPLSGSMVEPSLAVPPYNGTAQTDFSVYTNNQTINISGQAISTSTGLPVPNVPLNIGFATRGYVWFQAVTTDTNGNYTYAYNPAPGFSGTLSIWAANPEIVDQLNQVTVSIYRAYCSPADGDVVMSQNSTATFNVQLINPGNTPLTAFTVGCSAYQVAGTNLTPISTLTGSSVTTPGFTLAPNQSMTLTLQLAAAITAPTNAEAVYTFTSAEGAQATLTASVSLLPAVPVINVVQPAAGYVEVNVNRGDQVSSQVTIENVGLTTLKGIMIQPPTNTAWMSVNLPVSTNGQITLPDLLQGQSNTFTVVFTPPASLPLAQYQDYLLVEATNLNLPYRINLYGLVTSDQTGSVQFQVEDYLGNNIDGASVRLQNNLVQSSAGPFLTDSNGLITISNLMEGVWSWQASAPGCSPASGTVNITADQTAFENPILIRSLVTVNFSVVPVPFTDQYEIQVEQTFETFVPVPELVMTPPYTTLTVSPGFQATLNISIQDAGLIKISDVSITGQQTAQATMTPLITYIPVLMPQQTVSVPFVVTYSGNSAPSQQDLSDCLPGGNADLLGAFAAGIAALANGEGLCPASAEAIRLAGQAAIAFALYQAISNAIAAPLEQLASLIGCLIGNLFSAGDGSGDGGGGAEEQAGQSVGPGGGGCFTLDTPVLMADGTSKPISEVRTNDVLRSGTRTDNLATVEAVYFTDVSSIEEIDLAGRTGAASSIRATREHFFWVDGEGWRSVAELRPGDWVFDSNNNRVQISAIKMMNSKTKVCTVKLSKACSFYANNILVHDLCGSPPEVETARGEATP